MIRNSVVGLLILVGGACVDLATVPRQVPTSIQLSEELVTTTAGGVVPLGVTVLDQRGDAIINVPDWAKPAWTTSNGSVVQFSNDQLKAIGPGQVTVTASIAGLENSAVVRVNPASLKLDIANVQLAQAGNQAGFLTPGVETTLSVFLVADAVNFFQPEVKATLLSGDDVLSTYVMQRDAPSIPLQLNTLDPNGAWTASIPGEFVQPGLSLVIEADPQLSIPRSPNSSDRYPEGGAFFLAVGESAVELRVEGAYLTQSIQRFDGSIPLVQGRDALLRVFLTSDEENPHRPLVRATFYRDGQVVHQVDMTSDAPSIPLLVQEALLSRSWNATIPGAVLQPGVSLVVQADPGHLVPLKLGSEPRLPGSGMLTLDVRPVPPLWLRMIPIQQASSGITGNISSANLPQFVQAASVKFPLAQIHADVRQPYITTSTASTSVGWLEILNEIRALRVADNSARYYYGVLRHPGGTQIGGLGYIGQPAAIGYDDPSGAMETFAHELGHNFSLRHAPCGGPSDSDPMFPHAGGGIGYFGYDLSTGALKTPDGNKDLMTYCAPEWISDYSYVKALGYRESFDWTATGPDLRPEDALLVWGGVIDGGMVLEPSFQLPMVPALPSGSGAYTLRGLDANGAELFSYRFEPDLVDHLGARSFAFAIPARLARTDRLVEIVFSGPGGEVRRRRSGSPPGPPGRAPRPGVPLAELTWDPVETPMALIRDSQTGQVISFARGGRIAVPGRRVVEVLMSDGVRSTRQVVDLR